MQARRGNYPVKSGIKIVMTSLPHAYYSAEAIANPYKERWEIELGFRDIKSSMQKNAITLRSKKEPCVSRVMGAAIVLQLSQTRSVNGRR